jgi:ubiquinone biosynthesis protein
VLAKFVALGVTLMRLAIRRQLSMQSYARCLRRMFEEIGGLWIKVAQLLSLRIDVFPLVLCRELALLQEQSVGFPAAVARETIESELGAPLEKHLAEFEETPFAAVPWGQVHRARLRQEGVWVAIKVQQPYLAELFARDMTLVRGFVRLFVLLRVHPQMRWAEGLAELVQIATEDLDFHYEAAAMRRLRRTLARHGIYVPRVFSRYSTARMLTSEFIHAVLMSDYLAVQQAEPDRLASWLAENQVEPRLVARRLFGSLLRQLFEDNLYHGDPRPENIVLLRGSRLAFIDFRAVHFTEREYLQKYQWFVRALATRDYAKAADLAFMLCAILPVIDVELAKQKVIRALRAWATRTRVKDLPYHERSIDCATAEVVDVLSRYKCSMEWPWLRIHRAMAMLDLSLARLNPRLNHTRQALRYFDRANRRSLQALLGPELFTRSLSAVRTTMDIQERLNEYTMFQSSLIRRHAQVFQGATNKFADTVAAFVGVFSVAVLIPGVAIAAVLLGQRLPEGTDLLLGPQLMALIQRAPALDGRVVAALLLLDLYVFGVLRRVRRRLRQKDIRHHERVAAV